MGTKYNCIAVDLIGLMYCWVEVSDRATRLKFPSLTFQFAKQPCDERNVAKRSNLDCVLKLFNRFAELKTSVPEGDGGFDTDMEGFAE